MLYFLLSILSQSTVCSLLYFRLPSLVVKRVQIAVVICRLFISATLYRHSHVVSNVCMGAFYTSRSKCALRWTATRNQYPQRCTDPLSYTCVGYFFICITDAFLFSKILLFVLAIKPYQMLQHIFRAMHQKSDLSNYQHR